MRLDLGWEETARAARWEVSGLSTGRWSSRVRWRDTPHTSSVPDIPAAYQPKDAATRHLNWLLGTQDTGSGQGAQPLSRTLLAAHDSKGPAAA